MWRYKRDGLGTFSFELFYQTRPKNPLSKFILRRSLEIPPAKIQLIHPVDQLYIINKFLNTFWHVSSFKKCDDLIFKLSRESNIDPEYSRRHANFEKLINIEDLDENFRNRIITDNQIDNAMFEIFCGQKSISNFQHEDNRLIDMITNMVAPVPYSKISRNQRKILNAD